MNMHFVMCMQYSHIVIMLLNILFMDPRMVYYSII